MNEAIKLAIEKGGYPPFELSYEQRKRGYSAQGDALTLDPLFWQALGKALGWKKYVWLSYPNYHYGHHSNVDFTDDEEWGPPTEFTDTPFATRYITSQYYAHQYFDLVLTGGDTEKFWKELLT